MSDEHDDIDWQRSQVSSRALVQDATEFTGLGDPTRWGSEQSVTLTAYTGAGAGKPTQQLVRMQAEDAYPRNWQLVGHVEMSYAAFASPTADALWVATLDLEMGIGQAVVSHRVNLRALLDLAIPPAALLTGESWYFPQQLGSRVRVPWVLPGAIVARSLSVRATFGLVPAEGPLALPQVFTIACALSPFAAGHNV